MSALPDVLRKNRRRVIILMTSVAVGLNVVVTALLLASQVITSIKVPLTTFSNTKFLETLVYALAAPLVALTASIVVYYVGSKSSRGDDEFSSRHVSTTPDQIVVPAWTERFSQPLGRATLAAIVLVYHLLMAGLLITLNYGLEWLITKLWAERQDGLFGVVPFSWFFDAVDGAILLVFVVFGVLEVSRIVSAQPR